MLRYISLGTDLLLVSLVVYYYLKAKKNRKITFRILKETVSELDMKDPYFNGHTLRVLEMIKKIGKKLKLSSKQLRDTEVALYFSEIGKLRIPEKILLKREKLTNEEFEIIKKHPILAYKMIENIKELGNIKNIVKAHHEKYDGTGYPEKLLGDKIPMGARIIHLADSYDAMISDRPYKKALSKEEAVEEILNQKGKQFDPDVVDAFINELE